jgi:hypothetical protein
VKLHPVTQLILFAVVLWLVADIILLASDVKMAFGIRAQAISHSAFWREPLGDGLRILSKRFVDISEALAASLMALWVELLYRSLRALNARSAPEQDLKSIGVQE